MKSLILIVLLIVPFSLCQDCQIIVPQNPLTLQGLTTPFRILAPCNQTDPGQTSFVHGVLVDSTTGALYVYNPVVVNNGESPGAPPVMPQNPPPSYVAALWFGTNAGTLTLVDDGSGSLTSGNCVNGIANSIFGQFSYCNANGFFAVVDQFITSGRITVPPLGIAIDKQTCPTIRDFFVIDMDQSDNVVTTYLLSQGKIWQDNTANRLFLNGTSKIKILSNGSDNRLLSVELAAAMGCPTWKAMDLADPGIMVPALPLNELQAKYLQQAPIAYVPLSNPMVRVNGQPSLEKTNAYRNGVFQPFARSTADADPSAYCNHYYHVAPRRLMNNAATFSKLLSPDLMLANSLYAFLAQRFFNSFGPDGLNCANLLGVKSPVTLLKQDGIVIGAQIIPPEEPTATPAPNPGAIATIIVVCILCGLAVSVGTLVAYKWEETKHLYRIVRSKIRESKE